MLREQALKDSEEEHYLSHDLLVALGLVSVDDGPDHPHRLGVQAEQQPTSASSVVYSDLDSSLADPHIFDGEEQPYDNALSRFSTGSDDNDTSGHPQAKSEQLYSSKQHNKKAVKKLLVRVGHTIAPNQDIASVSKSSPDYIRPGGRGGHSSRKDDMTPNNAFLYSKELLQTSSGSVSEHSLPPASASSSELGRVRPGGRAVRIDRSKQLSFYDDTSSTSSTTVSDRSVQSADRSARIRASGRAARK